MRPVRPRAPRRALRLPALHTGACPARLPAAAAAAPPPQTPGEDGPGSGPDPTSGVKPEARTPLWARTRFGESEASSPPLLDPDSPLSTQTKQPRADAAARGTPAQPLRPTSVDVGVRGRPLAAGAVP
ncbi:hypothetical protein TREES_T100004256 [Tupaia chinensis]|uniref:Uncharacterized protein n=1 Tax=Tupaia chinensis TaxID=246437 RepID=L9KH51_TUPCH|nr:hypothetical protein TREES_T100004256 [Tupaia chinensis]